MADLLLYSMRRHGKPATAAELADISNGIAMDAMWPARFCKRSPKQIAALLRSMAAEGRVKEEGTAKDKGNDRVLWVPAGDFSEFAVMPDAPVEQESNHHPLVAMNRVQQLAVFTVQDLLMTELNQQRIELRTMFEQHDARLRAVTERTRAQLSAVGLVE